MLNAPSNRENSITLDALLTRFEDLQHTLNAAYKAGDLKPADIADGVQQLQTFLVRYFPQSEPITEASMQDLLSGFLQRASRRNVGAQTGVKMLDRVLNGGLQEKRLYVLLGAPGGGKTSLANQIAENHAKERPALYVTSEDTPDVLLAKTISRIGKIDYGQVLYGEAKGPILSTIEDITQRPSAQNLRYLDVTSGMISMSELRDRAASHFEGKPGPGLIVVDYLQRMARAIRDSGAGQRELREAVTHLTERLRALANDLNCCVLAIGSMNRASGYGNGKNGETSALSAGKESGDIEYTADVMMTLVEDTKRNTGSSFKFARTLRVDKNRQGETTTIPLDWYAARQTFDPPGGES